MRVPEGVEAFQNTNLERGRRTLEVRDMSFVYITEEGAYVQKRGGNFIIGRNRECIMEIPEEVLEGLTLIDRVQVFSQAMVELLRLGIPVTWLSRTGAFFGRLESTRHVHVFRQEQQILLKGSSFYLALGRKAIAAKVHFRALGCLVPEAFGIRGDGVCRC